jgi:putative transposase
MRNNIFVTGEYYHVYNRGTDKRKTFLSAADYRRFLDSVVKFNSNKRIVGAFSATKKPLGESIVKVIAYCLMPNHFHFIVQQVQDGGISKFMQKLLTGYTMYFNKCYDRTGVLFQGVFKSKHIKDDSYLLQLSRYIHLNPIDLIKDSATNSILAERYVFNYLWSSLTEYTKEDGDAISSPAIVREQIGGKEKYKEFVISALSDGLEKENFWRFRLKEVARLRPKTNLEAKPPN